MCCYLTAATQGDISFFLRADAGAGLKKMASEIKEDMKVVRRDIHLTCMTVLIDVSGHESHITQRGWAVASCCKQKSH